ncbi:group I truncated hemoglobin [Rheinheimera sp. MM224]|uniref:group I truncated hemoglobin n=1 Tax=Rheinheimera sp. MM224 TaxID=3019969 RepID=UPI0021F8F647|nr:group 1 truncated hemoglobin [Rheinheimera sp. MM224]CAI3804579.1 Group 1 truncated hemoglobin GlbN [Rheinheimera sp. MM224]
MVKYLLLLATLVLTACQQSPETTLYQRLGGETGVEKIVDGVLYGIEHDQSIVHHFSDTDIPRFRRLLIEQFCELSGGPCKYTGASMQESHTGFQITQAHFDALVNHLITAMQQQKVAIEAQNEFLAILAPMYKDVVYR